MKNKKYMSALAALSLLLPIGAFAQTSSPGTTGTSGTTGSTGSTGTSRQYPDTSGTTGTSGATGTSWQYPSTSGSSSSSTSQQSGAATDASRQYPSSTSSAQHMGSQAMSQDFKRIKEDRLKDEKRTAEHLMGKKIVDRDGQTIGEIKDIGLSSVLHDDSSSQVAGTTGTSGTSSSGTTGISGTTGTSPSASATVGAGAMTGRTTMGMMGQEQVQLYVKLDNAVGLKGDDLAVIPASSVRYDSSKQQLKLQISRSELATKLKQSESGQSSQR